MIDNGEHTKLEGERVDRQALRDELEATRVAFQRLLASLEDDRWRRRRPGGWTAGEIMVHLTWALEQLPREVDSAKRGKGMFNLPQWLADTLNHWYTRWMARNVTPESIGQRYNAAMAAVLRTLDDVQESDWTRGAPFYGHGFYSVADLFRTPAEHLAEHTADFQWK